MTVNGPWRGTLIPLVILTVMSTFAVGVAAASTAADHHRTARLGITTVSNPRPSLVSGGQVLVRVTVPDSARVRITENGRDVTSAFRGQSDGSLLGLVRGLRLGANELTAGNGRQHTELRVVDHPITGPVFSGPRQVPFFCQTQSFGLAPAVQPLCGAPTVVSYQYRNTAGVFVPLADPAGHPADLATAMVSGHAVPYVVRVETGTIDRAVYQTAALFDGRSPSPLVPDRSWNGRLVYTFGGGCNAGYHQGDSTGGVLNDLFLGQGYAIASSSLNVLDNNCSAIISAEAAMMVKEHFIDTYGPVAHTIGWGAAGGAGQYEIADAYPGILDGIIPGASFPDPISNVGPVNDCRLLVNYFAGPGASFTSAQRTAVAGYHEFETCVSWTQLFANRSTATGSCDAAIPLSARWNPVTNPDGVKCNVNEQVVNQFGRNPSTGFVRSPSDNTGVQYGLSALLAQQITPAQFVALNAGIGGLDVTGQPMAGRTAADPGALAAAYADDLVNSAGQGLRDTPIIDHRRDLDRTGFGNDVDTAEWSFITRQRLLQVNGTAANQVIIQSQPEPAEQAAANAYELNAMDRWLTAIDADTSRHSQAAKVIADKPADLGDGCYLSTTQRVVAPLTDPATGPCAASYPIAANPRLAGGESLTMNVLKCALTPVNFAGYAPNTFTAAEKAQLQATFPTGVCDYHRPGIGQQHPIGAWLNYGDERGPIPIPDN